MRKTNLFYSQGQDSNFVTFSNYTEALTGVVIATNYKLFPSRFICMNIPKLNEKVQETDENNELVVDNENNPVWKTDAESFLINKQEFITSYLAGYYENKLAVLRDRNLKDNINSEQNLNPLDYLLYGILQYDSTSEITFIGDICEQDYNGTFMDNICIIENNAPAKKYIYEATLDDSDQVDLGTIVPKTYKDEDGIWKHKLYGWAPATTMPNGFDNTTPKYDIDNDNATIYTIKNNSSLTIDDNETLNNITFNVLIPLYDVFEYNIYNNELSEKPINEKPEGLLILNSDETNNQYDIPIGMWFSDKTIVLERALETTGQSSTYRPSWSLCISSQFKPFPYGESYPNEIKDYDNPDKFASFALIMAKQAFITDEFNTLNSNLASLSTEVKKLSTLVRSLQNQEGISDSESNVTDETIELINDRLNTLNDSIRENGFKLNSIENNYLKISDLGAKLTPYGFLTEASLSENYVTQSQLANASYLSSSDTTTVENMLKTSSYISKIVAVTNTDFKSALNNSMDTFFEDVTNAGPKLTKRVKNLCGDNGFTDVFDGNSVNVKSSTINNVSTKHSISGLISIIKKSYTDTNTEFNSIINNLTLRVNDIDGKDIEENQNPLGFDVPALKNAITSIETKLNELRAAILNGGLAGNGNYQDTSFNIESSTWADVSNNGTIGTWN